MNRYLVFDEGCRACNSLAEMIQDALGTRLEAISIYDAKTKVLLDQAYPHGWYHLPYLIVVDKGRVRAWTGMRLALHLGLLLGPRKAWQVYALAQRSGARLPVAATTMSRRSFMKLGTAIVTALGLAHFDSATPTSAAVCPCTGTLTCNVMSYRCVSCNFRQVKEYTTYCYNNCWEYCKTTYRTDCLAYC